MSILLPWLWCFSIPFCFCWYIPIRCTLHLQLGLVFRLLCLYGRGVFDDANSTGLMLKGSLLSLEESEADKAHRVHTSKQTRHDSTFPRGIRVFVGRRSLCCRSSVPRDFHPSCSQHDWVDFVTHHDVFCVIAVVLVSETNAGLIAPNHLVNQPCRYVSCHNTSAC